MQSDIVQRLRKYAVRSNDGYLRGPALEAADEIERNCAEITRMTEALCAAEEQVKGLREVAIKLHGALAEHTCEGCPRCPGHDEGKHRKYTAVNRSAMERIAELLHEAGYRPTRRFMGMALLVYDYARKRYAAPDRIEALRAAEEREKGFVDALIWCSGSADFNEGGQAREGWLKLCRPLIDAALKGPSHDA